MATFNNHVGKEKVQGFGLANTFLGIHSCGS